MVGFSEKRSLLRFWCFWAALPGAQPWKGLRPQMAGEKIPENKFIVLDEKGSGGTLAVVVLVACHFPIDSEC